MKRIALIVAGLLSLSVPASAQLPCGPYAEIAKVLSSDRYREEPRMGGVTPRGEMIEIWVSRKGSFSVVVRTNGKTACIVMAGEDWFEKEDGGT